MSVRTIAERVMAVDRKLDHAADLLAQVQALLDEVEPDHITNALLAPQNDLHHEGLAVSLARLQRRLHTLSGRE